MVVFGSSQLHGLCEALPKQGMFSLEPLAIDIYIGEDKLLSDMTKYIRFWVHRQFAKKVRAALYIFDDDQFEEVAWEVVNMALKDAPRMFQIWASMVSITAWPNTKRIKVCNKCPGCDTIVETCAHVLNRKEESWGT